MQRACVPALRRVFVSSSSSSLASLSSSSSLVMTTRRAMSAKPMYTAVCTSTGGRAGTSQSNDGRLSVKLSKPKGIGGDDGPGTNPEQLFASGYSACFLGALELVTRNAGKTLPTATKLTAHVALAREPAGLQLSVVMDVNVPGFAQADAEQLVRTAHTVCPYSRAIVNNVPVSFNVTV